MSQLLQYAENNTIRGEYITSQAQTTPCMICSSSYVARSRVRCGKSFCTVKFVYAHISPGTLSLRFLYSKQAMRKSLTDNQRRGMNGVACSGLWLSIFCSLLSQLLSVCFPADVSCTPSNLYPLIHHSTALLAFGYLKPSSI